MIMRVIKWYQMMKDDKYFSSLKWKKLKQKFMKENLEEH